MTGYRKNTWLAVLALVLGLVVFPFSYSEAQSSHMPLSASVCEQVSFLTFERMNAEQAEFARECDTVEASHDWEQQYGGLNDSEFAAAVVYE